MPTGNATRFIEMGVPPRLAREYAAQITAGVGNQRRLIELGVVPAVAKLLASVFSGGTVGNDRLAEGGMIPRVIREIKAQAGGGTPTPTPTLNTLTLSAPLTNGTTSSGTISGATSGSTITSNVTGLSVNSGARTYTFDGTAAAATISNGLVETLAGATGSPKSSPVTVGAAATALLPLNAPYVINGNSRDSYTGSVGYQAIAQALAGGRFYLSPFWRWSNPGDRTDDYLSRIEPVLAAAKAGTGATTGALVCLGDPGNNIQAQGTTTAAFALGNYREMAERALNKGSYTTGNPNHVVLLMLSPKLRPHYTDATLESLRQAINQGMIDMCAEAQWNGRLQYVDMRPLDPYLNDTAESADGIHYLTAKLALRAANLLAAKIMTLVPSTPMVSASTEIAASTGFGANINTNWQMVDASPDDNVIDGFTTTTATTGATVTFDASTGMQKITKSGSATNRNVSDTVKRDISVAAMTPGRFFEAILNVSVVQTTGSGSATLIAGQDLVGTPGSTLVTSPNMPGPINFSGLVRAPSQVIWPASSATTFAFVTTQLASRGETGADDAAITATAPWFVREIETDAYAVPMDVGGARTRPSKGDSYTLYSAFSITDNGSNNLVANRANLVGGGWFKAGGSIVFQWQRDTGGGFVNVGTNQRVYNHGGASGSYRCQLIPTNALGTTTLTSNTIVVP